MVERAKMVSTRTLVEATQRTVTIQIWTRLRTSLVFMDIYYSVHIEQGTGSDVHR